MNAQQKLKLFWKITNHINKKFCYNNLLINEIIFLTREKVKEMGQEKDLGGVYMVNQKVIGINKEISFIGQIETLCHELTHAHQHQIENYHRDGHNKAGREIYRKFTKETDKIVKISLK